MDFFEKLKRINDEKNKNSKESNGDNNLINGEKPEIDSGSGDAWDDIFGDNGSSDSGSGDAWDDIFGDTIEYDFKYLFDLINNSSGDVVLQSDIVLTQDDIDLNFDVLSIDAEDIVIDGNGHVFDGRNECLQFHIASKNITFKNIIFKNFTKIKDGLFNIHPNSKLKIVDCEFHNLKGDYGPACMNFGYLEVHHSKFYDFEGTEEGGVINIQKNSSALISNCEFYNNVSRQGGVFMNWGSLAVEKSLFKNNSATESGGICVNESEANLKVVNSKFYDSRCGVLFNLGNANVSDSKFVNNHSDKGGAIYNFQRRTVITNCDFSGNVAQSGNSIFNSDHMEIYDSNFCKHDNFIADLIFNNSYLKVYNSNFNENKSRTIITTYKKSSAVIEDCDFGDNNTKHAVIYNDGDECNISGPLFENNIVDEKYCINIYNASNLILQSPKLRDDNYYLSIINMGILSVKKMQKSDIDTFIYNEGTVNNLSFDEAEESGSIYDFDFSYLDNIICDGIKRESSSDEESIIINLDEDIILNDYEIEFYGGGIELGCDNLIIDGHGHFIDAKGNSRIFHIMGKNVTLKNIVFKNGIFRNDFDKYIVGGGAIAIVRGALLNIESCKFENNFSDDLGGVIFNNGSLFSNDSIFINNSSENYGGAVYNNGLFVSQKDSFENNSSKCGGAIYSLGKIHLDDFKVLNNKSAIPQSVFNCGIISKIDEGLSDEICNVGFIENGAGANSMSFKEFINEIEDNPEINLNLDVIFDYGCDDEFKSGITFNQDSEIIVNGNGYSIDGNGMASLLNINSGKAVVFKNVMFRNAFSMDNPLIRNSNEVIFENCKFINNKSFDESVLIELNDSIKVKGCIFSNNFSKGDLILQSDADLEIEDSHFIGNFSQDSLLHNKIDRVDLSEDNAIKITNTKFLANNSNKSIIFNDKIAEICDCEFINNISESNESLIYNSDFRDNLMKVHNSRFSVANAKNTGGIFTNEGKLEITSSKFWQSHAKYGGVIYNGINASLNSVSCEFFENSAVQGGVLVNLGNAELFDCRCHDCRADENGVAMTSLIDSNLKISKCEFADNTLGNASLIYILGRLDISDSIFLNNGDSSNLIHKAVSAKVNIHNCNL